MPTDDTQEQLPLEPGTDDIGGATAPAEPAPAALTQDAVRSMVEQAISQATGPLREKIGELSSTNVILQGMLRDRGQQASPAEPPPPSLPGKDDFLKALDLDPAKAILDLVRSNYGQEVEKRISGAQQATQSQLQSQRQMEQQMEQDRQSALSIADQWEIGTDDRGEFDRLGEEELKKLVGNDMRNFRPGHLEQAALRAERRMRQSGKQAPAPAQQRGTVFNFPRPKPGSSTGTPAGGAGGVPKSLDDLVAQGEITREEAEGTRRNIKKWALDESTYVKRYLESKTENPRFGTGV